MANTSYTQQSLGQSLTFRQRVQAALSTVAWQVLGEPPATPGHDKRVAYARNVLANLGASAQSVAAWLVERPNLMAGTTSYDFQSQSVVTDATDAAIESQIATDWDVLAGV